jgi:hypothetical protein
MNIFDKIRESWGADTCAPGAVFGGPVGQCAVTALVVQDVFGGEIVRADVPGYGSHYWNRLPGMGDIDVTREQFSIDTPLPIGLVVPRSRLLEGERALSARTLERYLVLKGRCNV